MAVMFGSGSCLLPRGGGVCDSVPSGAAELPLVFGLGFHSWGGVPFLFFLFFHTSAVAAAGPVTRRRLVLLDLSKGFL